MTFPTSCHSVPYLSLAAVSACAALSQGCGEAPMVQQGGESAQSGGQDTDSDVHQEANSTQELSGTGLRPTVRDEATLIGPQQEHAQQEAAQGQANDADECAPSVFPSSENVTREVTETVTETLEMEVERELPSTALLLLDRSLSMREDIQGTNASRWDTMQDILFGGEEPLLASLQSEVYLGMTHFTAARNTSGEDGSGHCVDLTVPVEDLSFEMNSYEALAAQQADIELGYGTPTGEALRATTDAFQTVETEGSKHIVVVTDGEPAHCNALLDFSSDKAVEYVIDAARDAVESGITVHVIGIGPDVNAEHLQEMAAAGGGLYRTALTGESLETAFSEILAGLKIVEVEQVIEEHEVTREVTEQRRSCAFQMEFGELGADAFLEAGSVRLDGEQLVLDADDGWTINAADELELLGEACESYLSGGAGMQLEAELACPNRFPGFAR